MPTNTATPSTIPAMVSSQRGRCCRTYGQLMSFSRIMDRYTRRAVVQTARAVFFNTPVPQGNQTRAAFGHLKIVRDDQNRRAQPLVQVANQRQNLGARVRIQVARGLVS